MPSIPPLTEWPWVTKLVAKHLVALLPGAHDAWLMNDTAPPPPGYASWSAYMTAQEVSSMDYLPLGPAGGLPAEGAKANLVWTREGEDIATCGFHFVRRDGSASAPVTDDDLVTLEGYLETMWTALKPSYGSELALDRIEWHEFGVTVRKPNPKRKETILTPVPGTGGDATDQLPPQAALSVTLKTDRRRSWGRFYLPAPLFSSETMLNGRWTTALVDGVRTAVGTMADSADGSSLPLVVWCPRHDGKALQFFKADADHPTSAHELGLDEPDTSSVARGVTIIQVDDIVDSQRRRRFDRASIKATHTI